MSSEVVWTQKTHEMPWFELNAKSRSILSKFTSTSSWIAKPTKNCFIHQEKRRKNEDNVCVLFALIYSKQKRSNWKICYFKLKRALKKSDVLNPRSISNLRKSNWTDHKKFSYLDFVAVVWHNFLRFFHCLLPKDCHWEANICCSCRFP